MKFHIIGPYDSLDKIVNEYAINIEDLKSANPNIDLFSLKTGDKLIIKKANVTFKEIEENIKIESDEYQKYICPHCKNVILIPK